MSLSLLVGTTVGVEILTVPKISTLCELEKVGVTQGSLDTCPGFIQASLSRIQGLFKDFYKTFLQFSRIKSL